MVTELTDIPHRRGCTYRKQESRLFQFRAGFGSRATSGLPGAKSRLQPLHPTSGERSLACLVEDKPFNGTTDVEPGLAAKLLNLR